MYRYNWKIELFEPENPLPFIDHWRAGSEIIQQYPGALGTHLHIVRDEPGSYFAVAEWESQAHRDGMMQDIEAGESELSQAWLQLPRNESFGKILGWAGVEIEVVLPQ